MTGEASAAAGEDRRLEVAEALLRKAAALAQLGDRSAAIEALDEVPARVGGVAAGELEQLVLRARWLTAENLAWLGRTEQSLALYDELASELADRAEPPKVRLLAAVMLGRVWLLQRAGRDHDGLAAVDAFLARFEHDPPPGRLQRVVRALQFRAILLARLGRVDEAVSLYEQIEGRYEQSEDEKVIGAVILVMFSHAELALKQAGPAGPLTVYDRLVDRYRTRPEPRLAELVDRTLRGRAQLLEQLQRPGEALQALEELAARTSREAPSPDPSLPLQDIAYRASLLERLDRPDEAITALRDLTQRGDTDMTPAVQITVARAELRLLGLLWKRHRLTELTVIEQRLITRAATADAVEVRDAGADALAHRISYRLKRRQAAAALKDADTLLERFEAEHYADGVYLLGRALARAGGSLQYAATIRSFGGLSGVTINRRRYLHASIMLQTRAIERCSDPSNTQLYSVAVEARLRRTLALVALGHPRALPRHIRWLMDTGPQGAAAMNEWARRLARRHNPHEAPVLMLTAMIYNELGDTAHEQTILRDLAERYPHREGYPGAIGRMARRQLRQKRFRTGIAP